MRISDCSVDERTLSGLAATAVKLLRSSDLSGLANQFGYGLALGRDPAKAIRDDLESSLFELSATGLEPSSDHAVTVKYFRQNDSGLIALIECVIPAKNGKELLVELIVTDSKHIVLEQISAANVR